MREEILARLDRLQAEEAVRLLLAIESGSRGAAGRLPGDTQGD